MCAALFAAIASSDALCLDAPGTCGGAPAEDALCLNGHGTCGGAPAEDSALLQIRGTHVQRRPSAPSSTRGLAADPERLASQVVSQSAPSGPELLQDAEGSLEVTSACHDQDGACAYYESHGYCLHSAHIQQYCRKSCGLCHTAPRPVSAPVPGRGGLTIKVASYNLFWWNAFDQNPWKGRRISANIKSKLRADTLGLQECNVPGTIQARTGYEPVSPFNDHQGVVVKPGLFRTERSGSKHLGAFGKWGPRFVNWVKLRHLPSGRSFFHFNTHWCVHSGRGHVCSTGVRDTEALNMLQEIRAVAGNSPVVITGDLNAPINEPGPQEFLRSGFAVAKNSGVDSILYSRAHWSVVRAYTGDSAGSDHRPILAELQLRR